MLLNSLYWENECDRLQLTSFVLLEKTSKMDNLSLQQIINRIPLLRYRYRGSFPSDYVPTLDNDTIAIINTQPSNMKGEHWIMIANSRQKLYFADSLGRKKYSFFKQQFEQMMPEPLQSHPSVCGFYTICAAFHLFKFRQEENTGVHYVNLLSFISNYMQFSNFSNFPTREIPVLLQRFTRKKIDIILGLGCEKPCESLYYLGGGASLS